MKRLLALLLFLTACASSTPYTWERYEIHMEIPSGYEVFAFNADGFHPDADPYNSALYINPDANEFFTSNSTKWTRLKVHNARCEEVADDAKREWITVPEDRCLEYKIGDGDQELAETILPTITFE